MSSIIDPASQADGDKSGGLTRRKVSQLLGADLVNPFMKSEEQLHSWSFHRSQELDCPLLRIWDNNSGSQPKQDGRMLARRFQQPLDTKQARKNSLALHLDHKQWIPTPYISFNKSATEIKGLAKMRKSRRRGAQTLTVIDPAARLRKGLPILHVVAEMDHYSIPDPYYNRSQYYTNHYVCLWEVTSEEIVGHYEWEELSKNPMWYEEVIIPALHKFRETKKYEPAPKHESAFDLSSLTESLPATSKSVDPSAGQ